MSSIKPKKGKCIDCSPDDPEQYLTAKRCKYHYWQHRNKVSNSKPKRIDSFSERKELDKWFAEQISIMPRYCEECGDYLNPYAPWGAKSYIAHILPKRHFKSVMIHPDNRMFLCIQCHTNLDNWPTNKVIGMKIMPLLLKRYVRFSHKTHHDELEHLPAFLKLIAA